MITLQGKVPRNVHVACSGGVDSMAAVDFLSRNHTVTLMFFDHDTAASKDERDFLTDHWHDSKFDNDVELAVGKLNRDKEKSESWEEYWRNQRYEWFHSFDVPVITCHHLDDCVETWIWSSLNGTSKIIPYRNKNVIRPFLLNRKVEFTNWANRNSEKWIDDPSNDDTKFMRNYIRHELMPKALVVNPGLHKVVRKKVETADHS